MDVCRCFLCGEPGCWSPLGRERSPLAVPCMRENTTECAHIISFSLYTRAMSRESEHTPRWHAGTLRVPDAPISRTGACLKHASSSGTIPKWCIDFAPTEIAAWLRLRSRRILYPTAAHLVRRVVFIIGEPCGEFFISHPSYTQSLSQLELAAVGAVPEYSQFISNRINRELHDVVDIDRPPVALRELRLPSR